MCELVLASKSPRRRELMKLLGYPFICQTSTVEEYSIKGESPDCHVTRLSELKAQDVGGQRKKGIIIGADTIVVLDKEIFGKPGSPEEAVEIIMRLQGHTHTVYTGFALYNAVTKRIFSSYQYTQVTMRAITQELAERYVETGEPLDKAGAYGIQGYGATLITSINGCFFTVMGLPIEKLMDALYTFSDGYYGYFGAKLNKSNTFSAELDS